MRTAVWQVFGSVIAASALIGACTDTVVFDDDGAGGNNVSVGGSGGAGGQGAGGSSTGGGATTSNKVDVLLVVDNSRGTQHMNEVLADSVPAMVDELEQAGVNDMHIGVITSSLGGQGADACSGAGSPTENDRAWLIDRGENGVVPTYDNLGFLAWDPNGTQSPPGESDATALASATSDLVVGAGDEGCGSESPLEAFYRFLVDPNPYESIAVQDNNAVLVGTDSALLAQRDDFLRPDSLLMIVLATDENDCSTMAGGQFYFSRQIYQPGTNNPYHLPAPRAACASDPNDPCCVSCGQPAPDGCDTSQDQCSGALSALDDNINLRCFDQKRRFGIDFLYPMDRYSEGLSSGQIADRDGNVVPNPLFAQGRGAELVVLTGIVGVPWQLVARSGDAANGMSTADELEASGSWMALIGDPDSYTPPTDPHMIESSEARGGLPAPGSAANADPIHGHEVSIPQRDDLQYACTWPLAEPVVCGTQINCACNDPGNDDPACQDPNTNQFGTTQYRGFAKPGTRPLQLMRALGSRAVVGSACPAQIDDPNAADYGYTPAFRTMAELAETRLVD